MGDEIALEGRMQSRTYNKRISEDEVEERVAYEVSVARINKIGSNQTKDESVDETNTETNVEEVDTTTEATVVEE